MDDMDLQTRKLQFLEEYLRINDEDIIEKLVTVLRKDREKNVRKQLHPMSTQQLADKLDHSEADMEAGSVYSQAEVVHYLK
jgi:hypothetical protein